MQQTSNMTSLQHCFEKICKFIEEVFGDKMLPQFADLSQEKILSTDDNRPDILVALDSLIVFLQNFRSDFASLITGSTVDSVNPCSTVKREPTADIDQNPLSTEIKQEPHPLSTEIKQEPQDNEENVETNYEKHVAMETDDVSLDTQTEEQPRLNIDLVQIKAPKSEIDRRIAAFIEQKQSEVDEVNKREFCSTALTALCPEESCARVDSVFVTRVDGKSHIKVTRVCNYMGPQTLHKGSILDSDKIKKEPGGASSGVSEGVEERLQNVETHLKFPVLKESKQDMFARLKKLEERILYLESLSPEYFSDRILPMPKRKRTEPLSTFSGQHSSEISLSDIDTKIQHLREELKKKRNNR